MSNRNAALDGLRGLAAVAVIFYHSILHNEALVSTVLPTPIQNLGGNDIWIKVVLFVLNGNNAVLLFFVLSGFVLRLSLDRSSGSAPTIILNFTIRRVCRLYPAMFFCIFCYFVLSKVYQFAGWPGVTPPDAWKAFLNATLTEITWHGPSRTIQAEMLAVPFLLVTFFANRAFGFAGLLCCLAYSVFAFDAPALAGYAPNMNAWLSSFILGMVVADKRVLPIFENISGSGIAALLAAFICLRMFTNANTASSTLGQIVLCAALVGAAYKASPDSLFVKVLNLPCVQFLGRISYSLYLINVLFLLIAWSVTDQTHLYATHSLLTGMCIGAVVLFASLPLSVLSERAFERGGALLGSKMSLRVGVCRVVLQQTSGDIHQTG